MRILLIDEHFRQQIQKVKAFAEKNVFTMDDLLDIKNGQAEPPGNRAGFSIMIPIGYKVVYSLEDQPNNPEKGLIAHMSISVDREEALPHPLAVTEIMHEFGIREVLMVDIEVINEKRSAITVFGKPGVDDFKTILETDDSH